jgi:uncharacterized protein (DUF1330 family)
LKAATQTFSSAAGCHRADQDVRERRSASIIAAGKPLPQETRSPAIDFLGRQGAIMIEKFGAYLIGHITVKDADKWMEYRGKVPATLAPWGAEIVYRGKRLSILSGEHNHTDSVVIAFPDADAVGSWFHSLAYQALIPLREQAADMVLVGYETAS